MKIEIGGKQVEVDDSFKDLTPEEQQSTANDIASQLGLNEPKTQYREPGMMESALGHALGAANVATGAITPVIKGAGHLLSNPVVDLGLGLTGAKTKIGQSLLRSVGEGLGLRGPIAPAQAAKTATKVADMASSSAIRDIAMQGLSKGVQGVTAAAGAIAPYLRGLGGAALALHSEGLNNGEDQLVQQMHQQQDQGVANGQLAPPPGPAQPPQAPYQGPVAPGQ